MLGLRLLMTRMRFKTCLHSGLNCQDDTASVAVYFDNATDAILCLCCFLLRLILLQAGGSVYLRYPQKNINM